MALRSYHESAGDGDFALGPNAEARDLPSLAVVSRSSQASKRRRRPNSASAAPNAALPQMNERIRGDTSIGQSVARPKAKAVGQGRAAHVVLAGADPRELKVAFHGRAPNVTRMNVFPTLCAVTTRVSDTVATAGTVLSSFIRGAQKTSWPCASSGSPESEP
jgi:hypothetical protein